MAKFKIKNVLIAIGICAAGIAIGCYLVLVVYGQRLRNWLTQS